MKSLLHDIFIKEDFESTQVSELTFYKKKSEETIIYYWLVVEVDTLEKVLELQDEWFDTCKNEMNLEDFDKNTSLLIINERTEDEEWKKEVLNIEEDPFQFKKYVLGYNQESLKELKEHCEEGNPESIKKLITDEKVFNDYKENYSDFTWHKLLYTISQKLPFINLNIEIEKGLDSLFTESYEKLEEINLYESFKRIDEELDDVKLSQLEDIEFEDLFASIVKEEHNGNKD
ncbi:ABC-three component system middle component 1 [Salegentibacter maritimus]|uniref:Uncharacterized protein n=1 Tax=Salegentibacter maritimus TaxID=2794347 RepID=A0ABS0TDW0_9FLAO|nr:ABC-three component system middle component 1 [Salegentibacter maritimus]MBI6119147.1 hypothetical protein [Salegentibacter maritimus]